VRQIEGRGRVVERADIDRRAYTEDMTIANFANDREVVCVCCGLAAFLQTMNGQRGKKLLVHGMEERHESG
jgi:hypothetical protein